MDTVTSGVMGAVIGTALFGRSAGRAGALVFAVASVLPDVDSLITGEDGLRYVQLHRGPTHSLVGAAVQGVLLAAGAGLLGSRRSFLLLTRIGILGVLFHIGTDAATWWGTQVLWPFSDFRVRYGLVFIIDPWLAAIAVLPFVAWALQKLRGRTLPWRAFRASAVAIGLYAALCFVARQQALDVLEERCAAAGCQPVDVLPQPFSPLRWALVEDHGTHYRLAFIDLLQGAAPFEVRSFEKNDHGPALPVDATPEGRILRWFYYLPVHEIREQGPRAEVVFRDVAYSLGAWPLVKRLGGDQRAPFRYRFVLEEGEIIEHGWEGR